MTAANGIMLCFCFILEEEYVCITQGFFVEFGVNNYSIGLHFLYPTSVNLVLDPLTSHQWLVYEIMWKYSALFLLEQNKTQHLCHISLLGSVTSDV